MSSSIQIKGIAYKVDKAARRYAVRKINQLYRYLPRHARKSVSTEVKLAQVNHDHGNKYQVTITMHVPEKVLQAEDSTSNIFAALDIVEAKMKMQITNHQIVI